jgi:hypothetical protein
MLPFGDILGQVFGYTNAFRIKIQQLHFTCPLGNRTPRPGQRLAHRLALEFDPSGRLWSPFFPGNRNRQSLRTSKNVAGRPMTRLSHPRELRRDGFFGQGAKSAWMDIEKQNGWDILPSATCSHIEGQDRLRGRVSEWKRRMAF